MMVGIGLVIVVAGMVGGWVTGAGMCGGWMSRGGMVGGWLMGGLDGGWLTGVGLVGGCLAIGWIGLVGRGRVGAEAEREILVVGVGVADVVGVMDGKKKSMPIWSSRC